MFDLTFPLFSSLPIELQSAVWEHAAAAETHNIDALTIVAIELRSKARKHIWPTYYANLHNLRNKGDTKHLLGTCVLARMTVLTAWRRRLDEDLPTRGKGWFSAAPNKSVQRKLMEEVEGFMREMWEHRGET